MTTPRPVYLLAPRDEGAVQPGVVPGRTPTRVRHPDELRSLPPGLLLLPVDQLDHAELTGALRVAAEGGASWLAVLLEGAEGGVTARPVSIGWPADPTELARWADGDADANVLELRHVLARVARGRHDVNNPLTSAMAETQLALMDATDPVLRTGLETIEEQLRRIRDLIADMRVLRPPR